MNLKTEAIIGIFILTAIASFLYMSVQLGAFRFDTSKYLPYYAQFKDVAGLQRKADVKIAGVKVGWVDDVTLEPDGKTARARLMILRDYTLYKNAYAVVRQEGMLGLKFLEVVTGDPLEQPLKAGDALQDQNRQFVSLDEILYSFAKVAQSVQELSVSLKDTAQEVKDIASQLKGNIRPFADSMHDMKAQVSSNIERLVCSVESTCNSLQKTTQQAGASLQHGAHILSKINGGQGTLGKLVNDDTVYKDVQHSVKKVCNSINTISRWAWALDSYVEPLIGLQDHTRPHVKGYIHGYFSPRPDIFFLGGVALSDNGFAKKSCVQVTDCKTGCKTRMRKEKGVSATAELQVGKVFKYCAVRFGLFESSLGVGIDWRIPLGNYTWLTTLEAYDFRGHHRFGDDKMPHLKWLNRFFVTPSLYVAFGAEDFISRHNKSLFLGAGVYFDACDLKRFCCS